MPEYPYRSTVVLGATGATGRVLVSEIARRGHRVHAVSRSMENLRHAFPEGNVDLHAANLRDARHVAKVVSLADMVFVCIGISPAHFKRHIAMAHLITEAAQARRARCLLLSPYWSYTPIHSNPIDETHPRNPFAHLARIRKQQEDIYLDAGAAVVHLPDFFGPTVADHLSPLNAAIRRLRLGKTIQWLGDPEATRDFFYVPDLPDILLPLAAQPAAFGRRINIPGSGPIAPRQLLEQAAARFDQPLRLTPLPGWLINLASVFSADIRAARTLLAIYQKPVWMAGSRLDQLIGPSLRTSYEESIQSLA